MNIQLNTRWRVVDDGRLQWILQRKANKGRSQRADGSSVSQYTNRSFCETRAALLRCVGEYCGEVDQDALRLVEQLPERYPGPATATTRRAVLASLVMAPFAVAGRPAAAVERLDWRAAS